MKTKTWSTISLFIFWSFVTAILTSGLVYYQNNKTNQSALVGQNNAVTQNNSVTQNLPPSQSITLTAAVVATHNQANDCWMILNNKVYDLTSFLGSHPGGTGSMLPYCGQDGSVAYQTKDLTPARGHSSYANSLLDNYYLGDLNQTITASPAQNTGNQGASVSPGVRPLDE